MTIGARIRTLRLRAKLRLGDIARRCDVTVSLLSKIETGAVKPTVATLVSIAKALRLPLSAVVEEGDDRRTVVSRAVADGDESGFERTDKGHRYRLIAGERFDKAMQPLIFRARRGEVHPGGLRHAGEEFLHILAGELDLRVGATTYHLAAGDGIYFDSEEEHDFAATTANVTWLSVFCEPPAAPRAKPANAKRPTRKQRS